MVDAFELHGKSAPAIESDCLAPRRAKPAFVVQKPDQDVLATAGHSITSDEHAIRREVYQCGISLGPARISFCEVYGDLHAQRDALRTAALLGDLAVHRTARPAATAPSDEPAGCQRICLLSTGNCAVFRWGPADRTGCDESPGWSIDPQGVGSKLPLRVHVRDSASLPVVRSGVLGIGVPGSEPADVHSSSIDGA